jgi:hypothetical protein
MRKGHLFFLIGLLVAGGLSLVFDIILPPTRYDLIWVGPLTIGLVILGFYYAILRFKMISLSTSWLKVTSYVVIISSAVIVYLLIFHLVFSALFKVANPSFQVILLNFIMIGIVLLLAPAISEIHSLTKSWILTKQIDIAYIVKKITALNRRKLDLKEVSGFLAEHMHFTHVGFLVNGRFYGSDDFRLPSEELATIEKLKIPEKGVWQDVKGLPQGDDKGTEISRIGVMTNAKGETIGQIILGAPVSKMTLAPEFFLWGEPARCRGFIFPICRICMGDGESSGKMPRKVSSMSQARSTLTRFRICTESPRSIRSTVPLLTPAIWASFA